MTRTSPERDRSARRSRAAQVDGPNGRARSRILPRCVYRTQAPPPLRQAVEHRRGQHLGQPVGGLALVDRGPVRVAAQELADGAAVAQGRPGAAPRCRDASRTSRCPRAPAGPSRPPSRACARTAAGGRPRRMPASRRGTSWPTTLVTRPRHTYETPNARREVRVVGGGAGHVALAAHDVGAQVGDRARMVDPHLHPAAVPLELVERAAGVRARGREVAEGVEAVDEAGADERADEVASLVVRVPVGELVGRHVEVDGVADLEAEARTHRGRPTACSGSARSPGRRCRSGVSSRSLQMASAARYGYGCARSTGALRGSPAAG